MKKFLALIFLFAPLAQAQTITINPASTIQTMDGFGASTGFQEINTNLNAAQADLFFTTTSGIGLQWIRIQDSNNGTNTPDLATLQLAVARGAKVLLTMGSLVGGNPANYTSLANAAVAKINFLQANGVPVAALGPENEPTNTSNAQWTAAQMTSYIGGTLGPALATAGLNTPIAMPEQCEWFLTCTATADTFYSTCLNDTNCAKYVKHIAYHGYSTVGFNAAFGTAGNLWTAPPAQAANVGVWMTEITSGFNVSPPAGCTNNFQQTYDPSIADALIWGKNIYFGLTTGDVSAWMYWNLHAGPYNGSTGCNDGLTDPNINPAKRFYVVGQWSKFVHSGAMRIGVTNPTALLITAFTNTDSSTAIVIENPTGSAFTNQVFSVPTSMNCTTCVTPAITDATRNLANQTNISISGGLITFTIPASSVVTLSIPAPATPPAISNLSVNIGPVGTAVTITGTNFGATQSTSTVTFNGTTATVGTWSATSITTSVPSGATSGNVVVTVGGIASNGMNFTVTGGGTCGSMPWAGIIDCARGIDWSQAGLANGGAIPSASWTQCGSPIAAYTGTAATISNQIATCSANQFVLLGSGTFNLSTGIDFGKKNFVALRGSGANSTFLVFSGSGTPTCNAIGGVPTFACLGTNTTATAFNASPPQGTLTAPAQGATSVTLSSAAGITTTAGGASPTFIFIQQCDTGWTGLPCTGSDVDNGNAWICKTVTVCSDNGQQQQQPNFNNAWQQELLIPTSIAGNVVTIASPIKNPNWSASQNPRFWLFTGTVQQEGLEDLSISSSVNSTYDVVVWGCYKCWVSGVRIATYLHRGIYTAWSSHTQLQYNYVFQGTDADPYGFIRSGSHDELYLSNISHSNRSGFVSDGETSGSVFADNFCVLDNNLPNTPGNTQAGLFGCIWEHSTGNNFNLYERNQAPGISLDGIHGSHVFNTLLRNSFWGWESCSNGTCGTATLAKDQGASSGTEGFNIRNTNRYDNFIGNTGGTAGFHTVYLTQFKDSSSNNHNVFNLGGGNIPPNDPLVYSTALMWGNWDNVTGLRFCIDATAPCTGSEVPTGAPVYPNAVPPNHIIPASFYFTSKPAFYGSIAWPPAGPDVSGGNLGQCSGAINTAGQFNGVPALTNAQCGGHGITAGFQGGHVNINPAGACYYNVMGGTPDGSGSVLPYDRATCFGGSTAAPIVFLSPSSISFGVVIVGNNSSQPVTLTNTGTATLNITSISITGANAADFSQTNTCGSTLTAGNSCTITAKFTPSLTSAESASVTIVDNAVGSPHQVPLTGTGGVPIPVASPNPVSAGFGNTAPLCLPSAACPQKTVTVTNTGNANLLFDSSSALTLTPTGSTPGGDFTIAAGTTCANGLSVGPGSNCLIVLQFGPTIQAVSEGATLTLTDNAGTGTQIVPLSGTGLAPAPATAFAEMREDL